MPKIEGVRDVPAGVKPWDFWYRQRWSELTSAERDLWVYVGWDQHSWDGTTVCYPNIYTDSWLEQSHKLNQVFIQLGYTRELWEEQDGWDWAWIDKRPQSTPRQSGIRPLHPKGANATWDVNWEELSFTEQNAWRGLGWGANSWNAYRRGERWRWNNCLPEQQDNLNRLYHTEKSWNDRWYETKSETVKEERKPRIRPLHPEGVHKTWDVLWTDLTVEECELWEAAGWNAQLWRTHHPSRAWDHLVLWQNISERHLEHLRKLYYTKDNWCNGTPSPQPTIVATPQVAVKPVEEQKKKEEVTTMSNEIKTVTSAALATVEATANKVATKAKKRIHGGGRRAICREVVSTTQTGVVEVFTAIGMDSPTAKGLAEWMKTDNGKALLGGGMGVAIECIPGDHPLADEVAVELQEEAISLVFAGPLAAAFNPIKKMLVNVFRLTGDTKAADQVEAMSGMADVLNPKAG